MDDLPQYMYQGDREPDQVFQEAEHLYRRVPPLYWDEDRVNLDAIDLPDMSVQREKYGPPESARLIKEEYHDWGVIGFQVRDIPSEMQHLGTHICKSKPVHTPFKKNYPHTEIQVFYSQADKPHDQAHIDVDFLRREHDAKLETVFPEELQLRWRNYLRRKCRISIQAGKPS